MRILADISLDLSFLANDFVTGVVTGAASALAVFVAAYGIVQIIGIFQSVGNGGYEGLRNDDLSMDYETFKQNLDAEFGDVDESSLAEKRHNRD